MGTGGGMVLAQAEAVEGGLKGGDEIIGEGKQNKLGGGMG
jgi:hypothetical protein